MKLGMNLLSAKTRVFGISAVRKEIITLALVVLIYIMQHTSVSVTDGRTDDVTERWISLLQQRVAR